MIKIPFNKPFLTGKETEYITQAVSMGKISGDGYFTKACHRFFEKRYGFKKVLLTTSCTDALEMAAILINTQAGDEIIVPSYTFVSTANAFVLRGANIVFADSEPTTPNIDVDAIASLVTKKTKAIVVVHYAGIACNMDKLLDLCQQHNLYLIEDAAHAIDAYYKEKPLGSFGHFACFSFHETKNVIAGEGGMLVINDEQFIKRAEIIREKGTNRSAFFRGEIDKYQWVDIGSSFLPSELIAAFLFAQLEELDNIQIKRKHIWQTYFDALNILQHNSKVKLPHLPNYATKNGHLFYLVTNSLQERTALIQHLRAKGIHAVFHYLSLYKSPFYQQQIHKPTQLPMSDLYTDCLLRLPLYFQLNQQEQTYICNAVRQFYNFPDVSEAT